MSEDIGLLRASIRDVPDFPSPGILFKDITPILSNGNLFGRAIRLFVDSNRHRQIDKVVGIDARGFIFGAAAAHALGVGFIPIRKKGKLPFDTHQVAYKLEYGQAEVEMHRDGILQDERVVIIDDLLATGGTAAAAASLVRQVGGKLLSVQFLIELEFLKGREKLAEVQVESFIRF